RRSSPTAPATASCRPRPRRSPWPPPGRRRATSPGTRPSRRAASPSCWPTPNTTSTPRRSTWRPWKPGSTRSSGPPRRARLVPSPGARTRSRRPRLTHGTAGDHAAERHPSRRGAPVAFRYDPELEAILAPAAQAVAADGSSSERGWKEVRVESELGLAMLNDMSPPVLGVSSTDYDLERDDGARMALRWYVPDETDRTSAVVYLHGGGMICGSVDLYEPVVAAYVAASGVRMLAVDYRVAPEHPHPTPVEDCFAALGWLRERAADLAIDPDRIAVMGDS